MDLQHTDPEIAQLIKSEEERITDQLQMIPSENYVSEAVRQAVGSVVMNKYSEGSVGKRYYQGNQNIDGIEQLAKDRALKAFGLDEMIWSVEVQAVTGAIANSAIYAALLEPGDKMLGMFLFDGGHLSHGWQMAPDRKTTLNSKIYDPYFYHVDTKTELFDYSEIEKQAETIKPKIIISGGTAYPREIDHKELGRIAKKVGAYYLADVSHEAGLILTGVNRSPFEHADVVMMTTRKTLRGPNGALIFTTKEYDEQIRRAVFPGMQGGPMNGHIAGIAVALHEAMQPEFIEYSKGIVENCKKLGEELMAKGHKLVSGGTDKHLILVDMRELGLTGREAAVALERANIIVNANTIPNDPAPPMKPNGLRMGTPALTSRGMKPEDMVKIANWIDNVLRNSDNVDDLNLTAQEVTQFARSFPVR